MLHIESTLILSDTIALKLQEVGSPRGRGQHAGSDDGLLATTSLSRTGKIEASQSHYRLSVKS